jgi:16S rRNA processing protein RimM
VQLVVARIGRAHGIKGQVTVEVRTDEPETRLAPGAALLTDPVAAGPLTVAEARWHSGRLLLSFQGVSSRSGAEALRGTLLIAEVDPEQTPEDPEEYYDHQLIGLAVVLADGSPVGELTSIAHLPAQDLLTVTRPDGSEVLVPFVSEIVPEVDLKQKRAVLTPPPGLLDPSGAVVDSVRDDAAPDAPAAESAAESAAEPDGAPAEASE